jgi:hypothetical protein
VSASQWRKLSQPALDYGTGAEQIARAAYVQILQNIASAAASIDNLWTSRDQDFATLTGTPYRRTTINLPDPESFYLGAQPSLVVGPGARFDKWPAITIRADMREPDQASAQPDQWDTMLITLVVEALAAAGPFNVEPVEDRSLSDEIDRQYQRLAEAVVFCVNKDRSLGGNCLPISLPPRITPSSPFVKRLKDGAGPWTLYQGAELVWIVSTQTQAVGL